MDANSPYWSLLQSRYLPNVNDPIASNSLLPFYFTRFPAAALLAQQRYLEESVSTAGPEITTTKPCDNECVADKIDVAVKSVDLLQAIVRISPDAEKKDEKTSEPGRFSAVRSSPLVAFPPPIAFPLSLAPESVGSIRKAPQVSNIKDSIPMTEQLAQSKSTDSCRNLPANLATKSSKKSSRITIPKTVFNQLL